VAVETGASLCPIGIKGAREISPQNSLLLKPNRLYLCVGQLMKARKNDWPEIVHLRKVMRQCIMQLSGEHLLNLASAAPPKTEVKNQP